MTSPAVNHLHPHCPDCGAELEEPQNMRRPDFHVIVVYCCVCGAACTARFWESQVTH